MISAIIVYPGNSVKCRIIWQKIISVPVSTTNKFFFPPTTIDLYAHQRTNSSLKPRTRTWLFEFVLWQTIYTQNTSSSMYKS